MDAETRHHLKQNELAEALGKLRSLDKSTVYFIAAILAVVLLFAAYRVWRWTSEQTTATRWAELALYHPGDVATGPNAVKELRDLVATGSDRQMADVARMKLAATLVNMADEDAVQRADFLTEAEQVLGAVIDDAEAAATVAAPAQYLLARICESRRDVEGARQAYEQLADARFAGHPFQYLAAEKLSTLDSLSAEVKFVAGDPPAPEPLPVQAGPAIEGSIVPAPVTPTPTAPDETASPEETGTKQAETPKETPEAPATAEPDTPE